MFAYFSAKMGNQKSTTPKPPTEEDQQIVSQIGQTNTATIIQNIEFHMSMTTWCLVLVAVIIVLAAAGYFIKRLMHWARNGVDRRAEAVFLKRSCGIEKV